jgi:hypothetical protein
MKNEDNLIIIQMLGLGYTYSGRRQLKAVSLRLAELKLSVVAGSGALTKQRTIEVKQKCQI